MARSNLPALRLTTLVCLLWSMLGTPAAAEPPKTSVVVDRIGAYVASLAEQLSSVVAEEQYRQDLETQPKSASAPAARDRQPRPGGSRPEYEHRTLRSDYALVRVSDRNGWVGMRDTFDVDGQPVRDREDRLQRLLETGSVEQAARIADESARFNLGSDVVMRNVNVPTLALQLLSDVNRSRFSFSKSGEERIGSVRTWRIELRERARPTFVRTPEGRDQRSHGWVYADPDTGEIWRTALVWDNVRGSVVVNWGHVAGVNVLVPVAMSERYDRNGVTVKGEATYTNFRQFQTGARLVVP